MDEADYRAIQNAAAALGERFDTVQIFVTKHNDGSTFHTTAGRGNWFARRGQVKDWMIKEDQKSEIEAIDAMEEPAEVEEDGDDEEEAEVEP